MALYLSGINRLVKSMEVLSRNFGVLKVYRTGLRAELMGRSSTTTYAARVAGGG